MDPGYDRRVLCSHVCRPYIHHRDCDRGPDHLIQRSHRYLFRTRQSEESSADQVFELVLPSLYNVLPLRRKRHLLLQTHCSGRQSPPPFRNTPPLHQLHALRHGLCLLRRLTEERPLPLPILPVRLDAYGSLSDSRPSALYHEQHLRRHDLVLPSGQSRHYQ